MLIGQVGLNGPRVISHALEAFRTDQEAVSIILNILVIHTVLEIARKRESVTWTVVQVRNYFYS